MKYWSNDFYHSKQKHFNNTDCHYQAYFQTFIWVLGKSHVKKGLWVNGHVYNFKIVVIGNKYESINSQLEDQPEIKIELFSKITAIIMTII
jgi:hypothetical protein